MDITQEPSTINEEYKFYIAEDIRRAISYARKGKMELSLEDIAKILKDIFTDEELVEIKKYL